MNGEADLPALYGILVLASAAFWPMIFRSRVRLGNVAVASLLAGPIFAACVEVPFVLQAIASDRSGRVDGALFTLIIAAVIVMGALLAFPANLIGSATMILIGDHARWARHPVTWALVGGAAASIPYVVSGAMAEDHPGMVFAFAITGACCALVCRRHLSWEKKPAAEQARREGPV